MISESVWVSSHNFKFAKFCYTFKQSEKGGLSIFCNFVFTVEVGVNEYSYRKHSVMTSKKFNLK